MNFRIAVFGAEEQIGQYVVAELSRRGLRPIEITLTSTGEFPLMAEAEGLRRSASVQDEQSLDVALGLADGVINCASPIGLTTTTIVLASLRAGVPYVDTVPDPSSMDEIIELFDDAAHRAGLVFVPSVGSIVGIINLVTAVAQDDWRDRVSTSVNLDFKFSGQNSMVPAMSGVVRGRVPGRLFAEDQQTSPTPSEIARSAQLAKNLVKFGVFDELGSANTIAFGNVEAFPARSRIDTGHTPPSFRLDVSVSNGDEIRTATMWGRDIEAVSARAACAAIEKILAGSVPGAGVFRPGEILDPSEVLCLFEAD